MENVNGQSGDLAPNLVMYQLLKPAPIMGPNGERQYQPFGMTQDFSAAVQWANTNPGGVVMLCVVLYKTAPTNILTPAKQ